MQVQQQSDDDIAIDPTQSVSVVLTIARVASLEWNDIELIHSVLVPGF
jgi:hypothetical protein